jgi:hypothetical protein
MKLSHLVTLVVLATPAAAAAAHTARFTLDEGRASAIFPDGAPVKLTMTPERLPGVEPATDRGPLGNLPPSQSWMDRGNGQTYSVMVIRRSDMPRPLSQRCVPPRTSQVGEHSWTSTCRLIAQNGMTVAEHRTARDDGGLTVMRTFESGDRRYLVSFMRMSDKLRSRLAAITKGPPGEIADGEAFLDSFRLESPKSH